MWRKNQPSGCSHTVQRKPNDHKELLLSWFTFETLNLSALHPPHLTTFFQILSMHRVHVSHFGLLGWDAKLISFLARKLTCRAKAGVPPGGPDGRRATAAAVCLPCVLISVNSDMTGSVLGRRDNGLLCDHPLFHARF